MRSLILSRSFKKDSKSHASNHQALAVARSNAEKLLRTPWHFRGVPWSASDFSVSGKVPEDLGLAFQGLGYLLFV